MQVREEQRSSAGFWAQLANLPLIAMSHKCTLSPVKTQAATLPSGQNQEQKDNNENPKHPGT